jgi:homoserine kinase type II
MSALRIQELDEILNQYNLGIPVDSELNDRGFVNISYAITTKGPGGEENNYFLRKYKPGIQEDEIHFEHSLICHLVEKKVCPIARLHPTRTGQTYLICNEEVEGSLFPRYYAIFDFLSGDDRYTWINPICTQSEIKNSAAVLAHFHSALLDFKPMGKRSEMEILKLLPQVYRFLLEIPQRSKGSVFEIYLLENLDLILDNLRRTTDKLAEPASQGMPQMPIHCDFHPGNLKFEGDQVTGLFDFDWSKLDYRCFDIGLALYYFFTSWKENDGRLRIDDSILFLHAYHEAMLDTQSPCPMDIHELKYLPYMISAANLYVLNWTLADFYCKTVDPDEYLVFLIHGVEFINWFNTAGNLQELEGKIKNLHLPPIN